MDDLQQRFNRLVVERLEDKADAVGSEEHEVELRELLLTMELSAKIKPPVPAPKPPIDWSKLLPLLITLGVALAAVVAAALGVDVRDLL